MKTRAHRMKHCLFAVTLALTLAMVAPMSVLPLAADEEPGGNETRHQQMTRAKQNESTSRKLEWRLRQLAAGPEMESAGADPGVGTDMTRDGVRVIIEHSRGAADDIESLVESLGGDIETVAGGKTQCIIPVEALNAVAEDSSTELVRLPFHPVAEEITEALEPLNADEWHSTGYSGVGLKVGVLDLGFHDYASLIGTELPTPADTWWAPSIADEGEDSHGTACAEVIHDLAPNADLYFANFSTDAEWDSAVAWLIGEGVDIISCSVGWYIVGPRDGTGDIVDAIDSAKAAGIFWSQAAGDYAERHWTGSWEDTDDDDWLDFTTSPAENSYAFYAEEGDQVWVRVSWDDPWGSSTNDYDLTVYDSVEIWHVDSWNWQGNGFDNPYEAVEFTAPADDDYLIEINRLGDASPVDFEIFCSHWPYYYEQAGSVSDNAASPNACSVGTVDWENPTTRQSYSAQGPTADSRTKPDLVAHDMVSTETYGTEGFAGTSAAAPHVAGVAALVLEAYPAYDEEDLQTYLETNAADLGDGGMDNLYGWGRVELPTAPATADFGDAPDPVYPTLLGSDGARHEVTAGFYLGAGVDMEGNALQNAAATGDDTADRNDDEDGVVFTSAVVPGETASLTVTASQPGKLDGWIDFNVDGDWDDAGEKLWGTSLDLMTGENNPSFNVPGDATVTTTSFARFRFSSSGGLAPTGSASDGEVEDYRVTIGSFDWGDAPDPDYPTLLSSTGARHVISGPFLGFAVDSELDGQPDDSASGDDGDGNDDDDGVSFTSALVAGEEAGVQVTASGVAFLDAWLDFNNDGDWSDDGEQLFTSASVVAGVNPLSFSVPVDAVESDTFARFRLSATGGLGPSGEASTGEVEDYQVTILPPPEFDFGDAPDPTYPTLLASNGARHIIDAAWYLGTTIDDEDDGQPGSHATGDDSDTAGDDEDGVVFTASYDADVTMTLDVTASQAGFLDAWVDFNDDGDWADAGEQVFASTALIAGVNSLSFEVPGDASVESSTFARFRFSDTGGLSYTGQANKGEVEDYELSASETCEIPIEAGWNLVSIPVQADDMSVSAVFPGVDAVYTWNPTLKSYAVPSTIEPHRGYWVASSAAQLISIEGVPVTTWTAGIEVGWNTLGSIYGTTVDISSPDDDPDGSLEGFAYAWNPITKSYEYSTSIEPGKGYWSAATQNASLTLS